MRCCLASAARVLTLISLALLCNQSLLLVNAQPEFTLTSFFPPPSEGGGEGSLSTTEASTTPPTDLTTSTSSVGPTTTTRPPSVPTTTTSPVNQVTTTTTNIPTPAFTSTSTKPTTSSTTSTSTSVSSDSDSSSSSSSSSTSSSSVVSSTSSSVPTSSSSSTSTGVTLISNTGTPYVAPTAAPTGNAGAGTEPTSFTWGLTDEPSSTDGVSAANASSASSSNFFNNKGAVAATFSVVGVVAVGAIIVAFVYAKRRAAKLQDEEDMTYFEKYTPHESNNGASSPTDMSFVGGPSGREDLNDAPVATHAAPDAYPDRAMHYGLPVMDEYSHPQPMDMNFAAGIDYPPNAQPYNEQSYNAQSYNAQSYNAQPYNAQSYNAQPYNPNQYSGYEGGYGTDTEYYDNTQHSPSSPTHPYADPNNSLRTTGAPPVQQYYTPSDVAHGEAR